MCCRRPPAAGHAGGMDGIDVLIDCLAYFRRLERRRNRSARALASGQGKDRKMLRFSKTKDRSR